MSIKDEQLKQCAYADLSNFDAATGTYHIPKYSKPVFEINKCYIVKVSPIVVNNTTSVEAANWNHGTAPKHEVLKIFISKALGKMIYVDSLAYNLETQSDSMDIWSGWLSIDYLTQIAVL